MTDAIPVITVDGPSGVGKGTISQLLARKLGWHFLDSGALYRLTALAALRHGLALDDEAAVANIARNLDVEFLTAEDSDVRIFLEKQDVSSDIRTEKAGNSASKVAALPAVREALLQRQRDFAEPPGVIADGRDMGTTVFPQATRKFFLTASPAVRAERRYKQLKEKGLDATLHSLIEEIEQRDERDRSRRASPLRPADDAVIIDTSVKSIDEVLDEVLSHCGEIVR
ncbi:MAG: (d)CMP kinase [Gammaproteobacteria bacterium]|nr:(d)CMP kinase [Gammaproteobacteria bacterium]MCW8840271.1 (d)CMP kinase [Gammaproteobacteria bacterium]MCW8927190.1 (d)CMP kinase [Gammaproteobacteria bacterium]MCW8959247.1 (d)CMP kinase [Gammaproteobacteria bacterium]MCW8973601.1 (d)CMP kinase [Gammaproteobacteria bacterium]